MSSALRVCPQCGNTTSALTCPLDGWATVPAALVAETRLSVGSAILGRFKAGAFLEDDGPLALYGGVESRTGRAVRIAVASPPTGATLAEIGRMQRAAKALEGLSHPGISAVLATGTTDRGDLAIVAEHVEGPSLAEVLRGGPLGPERTVELGLALFAALEAAHAVGVSHHDLTPERIRMTGSRVVVTDIGLADILRIPVSNDHDSPTVTRGIRYRAPEQARDKAVTRHADIYAVGAILYEALTGRAVFEEKTAADYLVAHLVKSPAMPNVGGAAVEGPLVDLILKCLEKKPWNRPDSAGAARVALEAARSEPTRRVAQAEIVGTTTAFGPPPLPRTLEASRPRTGRPQTPSEPTIAMAAAILGATPAAEATRDSVRPVARPTSETLSVANLAAGAHIGDLSPIARPVVRHVRAKPPWGWIAAVVAVLAAVAFLWSQRGPREARGENEAAGIASAETLGRVPASRPSLNDPSTQAKVAVEPGPAAVVKRAEQERAEAARVEQERAARAVEAAKADAEAKAKAEAEAATKREAESASARAETEAKAKRDAEAKADAEKASAKAEADAKAKREAAEAKAKADAEKASAKAEADAKAKREADAKAKAEAEKASAKAEAVAKAKREADTKAKADAEKASAKAEADAKAKAKREADDKAKAKREADDKAKREAEAKAKAKPATAATAEAERLAQERIEAADRAAKARQIEAEALAASLAEDKAKRNASWKAKVEAAEMARLAADAEAKEAARVRAEVAREARAEATRKAAEEAEKKQLAREEKAKQAEAQRAAENAKDPKKTETPEMTGYKALLSTVPSGAAILVGGKLVGRSPMTLNWAPGTRTSVWVMMQGFEPAAVELGDSQNAKMLRLELVPATVTSTP